MTVIFRYFLPALVLVVTPAAALAQTTSPGASAAVCARTPTFIGCLPTISAPSRLNSVPTSSGSSTYDLSVAQILGLMLPADVTAALGYDPVKAFVPASIVSAGGTPDFQAAQNALQGVGGGTIVVTPGTYTLAGNVYTAGSNTWIFQRGAALAGPGQLDAATDGQALGSSGVTLARLLSGTSNEFGYHVSLRLAPTSGSTGYEKAGFYSRLVQNDPSSYDASGNIVTIRDAVAFEGQTEIDAATGRGWGLDVGCTVDGGFSGYCVGGEFGVTNSSGADAENLGQPTSSVGVHAVAYGANTSTAAFVISGNGSTWQDGFVAQVSAISAGGDALSVRPIGSSRAADVAYVRTDGSALFAKLIVGLHTPASSSEACTPGQVADDASYHYVCVSLNTWKRVALSGF